MNHDEWSHSGIREEDMPVECEKPRIHEWQNEEEEGEREKLVV